MIYRKHFFRGYDKSLGRMISPSELAMSLSVDNQSGELKVHPNIILMEFSGKIDINRQAIYEGDICDVTVGLPDQIGKIRMRGVMSWIDPPGTFTVSIPNSTMLQGQQVLIEDPEVKGNIIENAHMLNEKPSYVENRTKKE